MMGKQALANGLIDEIGFMPEAEKYLKSILNIEPVVCW
jgi:ClpP class serine protease